MSPDLQVSVSRDGSTAVVGIRGDLDLATAGLLDSRLDELLQQESPDRVDHLVVDSAAVSFVDVAGLRVILLAADRLTRRGGSVALREPSRQVRRLLALLALDLPIEP